MKLRSKTSCLLRNNISFCLTIVVSSLILTSGFDAQADHKLSQNSSGQVIEGYDPVAYFTMGKAVPGLEVHCYGWLGAEWHFANSEHRKLFLANPGKYIPQYGGYSSVSSLFGGHHSADPKSWKIVDGKLYLFYKKQNSHSWDTGLTQTRSADRKWEKAKAGLLQY